MGLPQSKIYTVEDYYNMSEDIRAEIMDGQIYYQAAPSRVHQEILMEISGIIRDYIKSKGGSCKIYPAPFAVKLSDDDKTIVEPDISVICDITKLTDKGCTGAPDWIIEIISPSTSGNDYIKKLNLYADKGVREYWIVNPKRKEVIVYFFENNIMAAPYTFKDKVKVNIYEDFEIDFSRIEI